MTMKIEAVDTATFFDSIKPLIVKHKWLINEVECNSYPDRRLKSDPLVMTGFELSELFRINKDLQVIWGIFSSVDESFDMGSLNNKSLPWADGNKAIWTQNYEPQLAGAAIEIIFFDASFIIFSSKDQSNLNFFERVYPQAK
ncbi:MAG: hypothetical protein IT288_08840 [Bdellovibrionales bacterium]|nr:hypothetical protein [Bdellovibrionales bacterium]